MKFSKQAETMTQLRPIEIKRHFTAHAEGSVLISVGNTKVLCNASVMNKVPRFLQQSNHGWVTAEYSMLPRATHDRSEREVTRGKASGRTLEIQRLIGRSLRAAVDLKGIKDYTIHIDCDVIQADGGTRSAAITGGCIALFDALEWMINHKKIKKNPFKHWIAAISTGIVQGKPLLDLDYKHDSQAEVDMNIVMTEHGKMIEIQGTAEGNAFTQSELNHMIELAQEGILNHLIPAQHSLYQQD